MKNFEDYLNDLKKNLGSDYAIAQAMGITKQSVSVMRKGGGVKDENAVKVAQLLGIDPGEVLLAAAMARSQGAVRSAWENVSKKAGMAASVALVVLIFSGWNESQNLTRYTLCEVKETIRSRETVII